MKLPRDVSGAALVTALRRIGYEQVRQHGSHVRITTQAGGEHHAALRELRDERERDTVTVAILRRRRAWLAPW